MLVNKILLILAILSITFTQELKVEGNLNVTGAVINDSLQQVITSQRADIDSLQTLVGQLQSSNSNHESLISSLQGLITSL